MPEIVAYHLTGQALLVQQARLRPPERVEPEPGQTCQVLQAMKLTIYPSLSQRLAMVPGAEEQEALALDTEPRRSENQKDD